MTTDLDLINKEKIEDAEGVLCRTPGNSAHQTRDYSIPCRAPRKIALVNGYHLWWCSSHHQPRSHCIEVRLTKARDDAINKMKKIDNIIHDVNCVTGDGGKDGS